MFYYCVNQEDCGYVFYEEDEPADDSSLICPVCADICLPYPVGVKPLWLLDNLFPPE